MRLRAPDQGGREQRGVRFGVVIQSDALGPLSTVIVAPTSQSALPTSFRPPVVIGREGTRLLLEQMGAVDARKLGDLEGHLTTEEMWTVDDALALVVGLQ